MSDDDRTEILYDVRCECGGKLVDTVVDEVEVVVGEEHFPFRRTTDYLVCPACKQMYRVTDVGNDLVTNAPTVTRVRREE